MRKEFVVARLKVLGLFLEQQTAAEPSPNLVVV
jgi:hypothetical protein